MLTTTRRVTKILAATAVVPGSLLIAGTAGASASPARAGASASYHGFRQVPAPRYRVRQGDKEQILVRRSGRPGRRLSVLRLSQSVDDTAGAEPVRAPLRHGHERRHRAGQLPGARLPPNYLGSLNPWTGHVTRVPLRGPAFEPQGMVFISPGWAVVPG